MGVAVVVRGGGGGGGGGVGDVVGGGGGDSAGGGVSVNCDPVDGIHLGLGPHEGFVDLEGCGDDLDRRFSPRVIAPSSLFISDLNDVDFIGSSLNAGLGLYPSLLNLGSSSKRPETGSSIGDSREPVRNVLTSSKTKSGLLASLLVLVTRCFTLDFTPLLPSPNKDVLVLSFLFALLEVFESCGIEDRSPSMYGTLPAYDFTPFDFFAISSRVDSV